jgi:hypothetical protein
VHLCARGFNSTARAVTQILMIFGVSAASEMTVIEVLAPAFPLSHSAQSYFCARKKRVTPAAAEI